MVVFYIVLSYLVTWFLVWIAVKLDNTKDVDCYSSQPGKTIDDDELNYISYDIKKGNYWWLVIPFINLLVAAIYLLRGIFTYFYYNFSKEKVGVITDYLFGSKFKK